ncbi:MAG: DUF547 domain-containing protein [Pseudomonadota bacterium]
MNSTLKGLIYGVFVSVTSVSLSTYSLAADNRGFDASHWAQYDSEQTFEVDYKPMTSLLNFIQSADRSDSTAAYQVVSGQSLSYLQTYKAYLEGISVSKLNRDEQLAYWLNLHNLGVIEKIATNFKSRKKIKSLRGTPGDPGKWWIEKTFTVEGHRLSLEDIEQGILFGAHAEPLAMYGLIYGVQGTTSIGTEAFKARTVRKQLKKLAREFVNDKKNVKVTRRGLQLNSLYVWNQEALFMNSQDSLLAHINDYADDRLKIKLASLEGEYKVKHKFNWRTDAFVPPRQNVQLQSGGGGYGS